MKAQIKDWAIALNTPYDEMNVPLMQSIKKSANDWGACIIGGLSDEIPRDSANMNMPIDVSLRILGNQFYDNISIMYDHFIYNFPIKRILSYVKTQFFFYE